MARNASFPASAATRLTGRPGRLADPQGCRHTFAKVYETDLRSAVADFQNDVRSGRIIAPNRLLF